ncbi:MAG: hypothetical protein Q9M33_08435 [Robiginitomaculum sp.]|nr:hypothetical protein [Robiginitomaculum sp.]MDQ7077136.1 hypothetical protein [Robiginitomaculum sp.]
MIIPDWLFYILSTLFAGLLIAFSLQYWPGQTHEANPFDAPPEAGLVIKGKQLGLMQAAQGLTAEIMEEDDTVFLRAAAGQKPDEGVRSAGVFLTLPKKYSTAYANSMIEYTMVVRGAGPTPSPKIIIAYYAPGRGNSPRKMCTLSPQWTPCTMLYKPPAANDNNMVDYAGIWPDLEGLSRTVDIREISIKPHANTPAEASK